MSLARTQERQKRSGYRRDAMWVVGVMVVADESMMRHYDNEEHILLAYIKALMSEVANIFRYKKTILLILPMKPLEYIYIYIYK